MSNQQNNKPAREHKPPLVILTGPTAAGKTDLSIRLAKAISGEIISADSMQVYRGMDIGSAKIRPEEMAGVPHHLIDILSPEESFHVVRFQQLAKEAMGQIYAHGNIPILVGGTGFYIQAVCYDIDFTQNDGDQAYREQLQAQAQRSMEDAAALHRKLMQVDPASASRIHPNNVKRVIRALEFYEKSKTPISLHNDAQKERISPYNSAYFVLTDERSKIYQRIDRRVDQMIAQGLVEEVASLKARGFTREMTSMQGLGYKELLDYFAGSCTLEEAIYRIKRDSRHFAKRQLTWFRRERNVRWIHRGEYASQEEMLREILRQLKEAQIIA